MPRLDSKLIFWTVQGRNLQTWLQNIFLFQTRLEICQEIYTTKFSGERILHTENA